MDVVVSAGRLLVYHKHATSARTRFYCSAGQHVALFAPLPPLSSLVEERQRPQRPPSVVEHPASLLAPLATQLGLESGAIALDAHCLGWVDTPTAAIPVHLAHFTAVDSPPRRGGRRGCPLHRHHRGPSPLAHRAGAAAPCLLLRARRLTAATVASGTKSLSQRRQITPINNMTISLSYGLCAVSSHGITLAVSSLQ